MIVNKGKVIGRDGKQISSSIQDDPVNAHIPLEVVHLEQLVHTMTELTQPEIRDRIVLNVRHLADREYQRRVWVDKVYPHAGYCDNLTTTFETLDDTNVLYGALDCVGSSLKSTVEADAFQELGAALGQVFEAYGTMLSDAEYLELPEWGLVVDAAVKALEFMGSGGD